MTATTPQFYWNRDAIDKEKLYLFGPDGKKICAIWRSYRSWGATTGEIFSSLAKAKAAMIVHAQALQPAQ